MLLQSQIRVEIYIPFHLSTQDLLSYFTAHMVYFISLATRYFLVSSPVKLLFDYFGAFPQMAPHIHNYAQVSGGSSTLERPWSSFSVSVVWDKCLNLLSINVLISKTELVMPVLGAERVKWGSMQQII